MVNIAAVNMDELRSQFENLPTEAFNNYMRELLKANFRQVNCQMADCYKKSTTHGFVNGQCIAVCDSCNDDLQIQESVREEENLPICIGISDPDENGYVSVTEIFRKDGVEYEEVSRIRQQTTQQSQKDFADWAIEAFTKEKFNVS